MNPESGGLASSQKSDYKRKFLCSNKLVYPVLARFHAFRQLGDVLQIWNSYFVSEKSFSLSERESLKKKKRI